MEIRHSKYRETDVAKVISMDKKNEVEVSFEMNEVGEIENITLNSMMSQENLAKAMETIEQFKSWLPANEIGNRCKIKLSIPVTF
ncbi:MAG: hypothetical protein HKN39_08415 [Flavobacteriales bacterium]|nr:hypothetical protein [Flavobacteriales bacterium]